MPDYQMGDYEVVSDTRTPEASLRLLRVRPGHEVLPHYHRNTTQVYVVIAGSVEIQLGDGKLRCRPFDEVQVPAFTVHSLSALEPSVVLSISVPPLAPEDQHAPRRHRGEPSYGK